jgi:hypothetical protein
MVEARVRSAKYRICRAGKVEAAADGTKADAATESAEERRAATHELEESEP